MGNKVTIIGSIPKPIGGVSSFCYRAVQGELSGLYSDIYDLYPHKEKCKVKINFFCPQYTSFIYKFFWLWIKLAFKANKVVHFNFSSTRALFLLALQPKFGRKWVLTLHNGNLRSRSSFTKLLHKLVLRRIDKIITLSNKQEVYYSSLGFQNTHNIDSYLPPTVDFQETSSQIIPFGFKQTVLGSGYCLDFYRLDFLETFALKHPDIQVLIVLYGNSDELILNRLKANSNKLDNLTLVEPMEESNFLSLLSKVDLYMRPNDVDSFGIACADAITLGTKVIASDVCKRFQGVTTFTVGDYKEFENKSIELLSTPKKQHLLQNSDKLDLFRKVYKF